MASAVARTYNGGLGAGSRGPLVGSQGAKPPEAESFLALKCPKDCTNLPLLSILKGKLHMIFTTSYKIYGLCIAISFKCLAQLSLLFTGRLFHNTDKFHYEVHHVPSAQHHHQ